MESAYALSEFVPGVGFRGIKLAGSIENLQAGRAYDLEVRQAGQRISMLVDGIRILEEVLATPLTGSQIGLYAWGRQRIKFEKLQVLSERPRAFVVMQFAEPYDTFYREVILSQAEAAGYEVVRIDEKPGPGVIFQDIQREIEQADIVIAEITPANPNVFYELGYAHALGKPTILLAQREAKLPFDIQSFRVVFYNDTIGGKAEVEQNLKRHLEAIADR
jgi:hypothetical protein